MNLAIFNGADSTGKLLALQALDRGHRVSILIPKKDDIGFDHPNLTVFRGDVFDHQSFASMLVEKEAVISCLGLNRWSRKAANHFSKGTKQIVEFMMRNQIQRFLCVTSKETCPYKDKQSSLFFRFLVRPFYNCVVDDLKRTEGFVKDSLLDWTIIRPPKLIDAPRTGDVRFEEDSFSLPEGRLLSRSDLAAFLLECLENEKTIKKAIAVAK